MSRLGVARLLATGVVVSTSTAIRTGARCASVVARGTPNVVQHAIAALAGGDDDAHAAALRDELIGVFRRTAEASWQELRRGIDDLDTFTRGDAAAAAPRRPFKVKP